MADCDQDDQQQKMEEQLRLMPTRQDCKQLLIENRCLLIKCLTHVTEIEHMLQERRIFSQPAIDKMNENIKSKEEKIGWILDALPRRSQLGYAILVKMLELTNQHELFAKLNTKELVLPCIQLQGLYHKKLAEFNGIKIKHIKEEKKIRDTDYIHLNMYTGPRKHFSVERRGIKEVYMNEKHTIKVNLEDLFAKTIKGTKENEEPRLVLLLGIPGSGKSHTCLHIVDQANEGNWKYPNTVPFVFCMRDITDHTTSLKDFLLGKCGPECNHNEIWKTLMEDDNFFVIIDGLDEDPLDCLSETMEIQNPEETARIGIILNNLIKGFLLPSAKILLTSRDYSAVKVLNFTQRIFELGGIPTEELWKLFQAELSEEKYKLARELLLSGDLLALAKVPVHAFGLIDFFRFVDRGKIETQTELLFSITIAKIVKTDRQTNKNNSDLIQVVQHRAKELRQIANLSKASFKTGKTAMAFTRAVLDRWGVTDAAIQCGIFTAYISSLRPSKEVKYHVPHLATFELLAGLGNTQENVKCLRSLVRRNDGQLDMVILYTAGFLGNSTFRPFLLQIFPETTYDSYIQKAEELMRAVMTSSRRHTLSGELFVIHTIAESQQWQLAPDVQRSLTGMAIDTSRAVDRQPSRKAIKEEYSICDALPADYTSILANEDQRAINALWLKVSDAHYANGNKYNIEAPSQGSGTRSVQFVFSNQAASLISGKLALEMGFYVPADSLIESKRQQIFISHENNILTRMSSLPGDSSMGPITFIPHDLKLNKPLVVLIKLPDNLFTDEDDYDYIVRYNKSATQNVNGWENLTSFHQNEVSGVVIPQCQGAVVFMPHFCDLEVRKYSRTVSVEIHGYYDTQRPVVLISCVSYHTETLKNNLDKYRQVTETIRGSYKRMQNMSISIKTTDNISVSLTDIEGNWEAKQPLKQMLDHNLIFTESFATIYFSFTTKESSPSFFACRLEASHPNSVPIYQYVDVPAKAVAENKHSTEDGEEINYRLPGSDQAPSMGGMLKQEVRDTIRKNLNGIASCITPSTELYNAFSKWVPDWLLPSQEDHLKNGHKNTISQVTTLLDLISHRTNEDFVNFCKALIAVGLKGVVKEYFSKCLELLGTSYEKLVEDVHADTSGGVAVPYRAGPGDRPQGSTKTYRNAECEQPKETQSKVFPSTPATKNTPKMPQKRKASSRAKTKPYKVRALEVSKHKPSLSAQPLTQLGGPLVLIRPPLNAGDSIALGKLLTHTAAPYSLVHVAGDIGIHGLSRLASSAPCVTVDATPISSTDLQQSHGQLTGLQGLGLCNAGISRYTLPIIAPALADLHGLDALDLSYNPLGVGSEGNIQQRATTSSLGVISHQHRYLHLASCHLTNTDISALLSVSTRPASLLHLDITLNKLSGVDELAAYIARPDTVLQGLIMEDCGVGETCKPLIQALQANNTIRCLDMGCNEGIPAGVCEMLGALLSFPDTVLNELLAASCNLDVSALLYPLTLPTASPHVTSLDLSYNDTSRHAIAQLGQIMTCTRATSPLLYLSLVGCSLQDDHLDQLTRALCDVSSKLTTLNVSYNKDLTISSINTMINYTRLDQLWVADCLLSSDDYVQLFTAISRPDCSIKWLATGEVYAPVDLQSGLQQLSRRLDKLVLFCGESQREALGKCVERVEELLRAPGMIICCSHKYTGNLYIAESGAHFRHLPPHMRAKITHHPGWHAW